MRWLGAKIRNQTHQWISALAGTKRHQIGIGKTRVARHAYCVQLVERKLIMQFSGKHHVRQLTLTIEFPAAIPFGAVQIVKINESPVSSQAAQCNDSGGRRVKEPRQQQSRQRKMS
ncbi:hypothetical protein FHR92_004446 [Fontibacillus solani]|uniref:Uncharacterized protein n=1 Tax=Fontibacillus solani TaxID=1572857 RepID=A0A7W3SXW4_9BACL|nr:hypothetical protein [Fontibacillus solani]MBA9087953.1 hypothetical protein [Fontibacillus solani]